MLGHTQISMTVDIYAYLLPSMLLDAVHRVRALLKEDVGPILFRDFTGCKKMTDTPVRKSS